ncbi:hypothetical protein BJF93_20035 [Xaviernesmea oryzae]|uniref:Uncharacterized protein n=1 Tax=Xaviernesmea oryzae TaxID=464029 RepID=A0A1Q9AYT6_9HYPH|nr:oligosaccharide flippase family protein [Xaviernesmea oryzae]OLP60614.1 hypothetical protein BJF93_20035 [Xaviernesmea oryzae]SEM33156.1 hypothetical protein SAMN04487976_12924 [Xaviernesmea oryzae]
MTIALAAHDVGFISFAWGKLAAALLRVVLPFQTKPQFWMSKPCLRGAREFAIFGGRNEASSVLDRTYEALSQFILSYIMPASAVGIYNRANVVCGLQDKFLLSAIFVMVFPAFSREVQNQRDVKAPYLRLLAYISVFFMPARCRPVDPPGAARRLLFQRQAEGLLHLSRQP